MAKVKIAIGLLVASLVLLVIYGADAAAAQPNPDHKGFLPLNESVRGSAFGGGAVIMSIIAFVIARKEPSKPAIALLIVNGALIIVGILVFASNSMMSIATTVPMGVILVGLGAWKAASDRRVASKPSQASR